MVTGEEKRSDDRALVIATFRRRMRVRLGDGTESDARIKGKRLRPVCGDRVEVESIANEPELLITNILERDNVLSRPNQRGKVEILAANLDRLVVMAAASPVPDWEIVDRYICAAELMGAEAAVIYNKSDLPVVDPTKSVLRAYQQIGYPTVTCSAKCDRDFAPVHALLRDGVSIIVGQSGVGKSTLINRILGDARQRTASVSDKSGEGRHTTVNSVMLDIPGGGAVIDSPGVRDYAPALTPEVVAHGFREISSAAGDCRFSDCRHLREPGCAVKDAVAREEISVRRYDSYRHLLALTRKLDERRY